MRCEHIEAAQGWLELGNPVEAFNELDVSTPHPDRVQILPPRPFLFLDKEQRFPAECSLAPELRQGSISRVRKN
jgi:hypothetical protein